MAAYAEYSKLTQELNKRVNLRGMLRFKKGAAVPLEEVRAVPACCVVLLPLTQGGGMRRRGWQGRLCLWL